MKNKDLLLVIGMYLCVFSLIGAWFSDYSQRLISADLILLTHFAQDFLAGKEMSEAYFDTNPPMSIIIYSVPAMLMNMFNISVFTAINSFTLFFLGVSTALSSHFLRVCKLDKTDHHFILCIYLLANTLFMEIFFGAKDHFILLALMPFSLMQLSITYKHKVSAYALYGALIIGSFVLMIKPHFYLVPMLFFVHRIYIRKNIWSVFDKDSFFLTAFAAAYIISLLTYFNDFITIIFPDVLSLYSAMGHPRTPFISSTSFMVVLLTFACALQFLKNKNDLRFACLCLSICLICIAIGHIQNKGHFLHYIPAIIFYIIGTSFIFHRFISSVLTKKIYNYLARCVSFASIVTVLYYVSLYFFLYPTLLSYQSDYKNHKLVQYVMENSEEQNSIYLMSVFSEYPHLVSTISAREHVSRFPSIWFWLRLRYSDTVENQQQRVELLDKYMSMVVEDIVTHQPRLLFFEDFRPEIYEVHYDFFDDMMTYGKGSDNMLAHYTYKETITLDRDPHMPLWLPEKTPFRVYVRN